MILEKLQARQMVALSLLALVGLTGCDRTGDRIRDVTGAISSQNLSSDRKLIENEESGVRLTVPAGWENVKELRPDADLYVGNEEEQTYVLVLAESKGSIDVFSLADNSTQYRRILARRLGGTPQPQLPTPMESIGELSALQYEIRGQVNNQPVVYLHTTIEGESNYYQVIGWTTAANYPEAKEELQMVIDSFRGA